jgi:hypothetical protein
MQINRVRQQMDGHGLTNLSGISLTFLQATQNERRYIQTYFVTCIPPFLKHCICICTFVYICMHMYLYICTYTYVPIHMYLPIDMCAHVFIRNQYYDIFLQILQILFWAKNAFFSPNFLATFLKNNNIDSRWAKKYRNILFSLSAVRIK